jgi:crotonobetainyl-CoA:carnitine CoA-transferase CaiB-like acyl-CoA transferase
MAPEEMTRPKPSPVRRRYRCQDGYIVIALENAEQWRALAKAMGRPELSYPGSWEVAASAPLRGRLGRLLEGLFAQDSAEVWRKRLQAKGIPCR